MFASWLVPLSRFRSLVLSLSILLFVCESRAIAFALDLDRYMHIALDFVILHCALILLVRLILLLSSDLMVTVVVATCRHCYLWIAARFADSSALPPLW